MHVVLEACDMTARQLGLSDMKGMPASQSMELWSCAQLLGSRQDLRRKGRLM